MFPAFSLRFPSRWFFPLAMVLGSACTPGNTKEESSTKVSRPAPAPVLQETPRRDGIVEAMLARAEAALTRGDLFSPEDGNAYLFFSAALKMDAANAEARSGLDALLIQELNLARDDAKGANLSRASQRVKLLHTLYPGSPLLKGIEAELRSLAPRDQAFPKSEKKVSSKYPQVELSETALKNRSAELVAQLRGIAQRVAQSNEYLLLYAPSDNDARWVYQVMREAVPQYRIRADIRIGRPAIQFLPPLEE